FHTNSDRARRLVFIEILESKVRSSRILDDVLDDRVNRRVVTALEVRNLERDQVGMARGKLRSPDLVVRAGRVGVLPDVADVEGIFDHPSADFIAEEPVEDVLVNWQCILRENRIPELLELFHDLVVHAGIMVVGTPKHYDADSVLALQHLQRFPSTFAQS